MRGISGTVYYSIVVIYVIITQSFFLKNTLFNLLSQQQYILQNHIFSLKIKKYCFNLKKLFNNFIIVQSCYVSGLIASDSYFIPLPILFIYSIEKFIFISIVICFQFLTIVHDHFHTGLDIICNIPLILFIKSIIKEFSH